ncbi:MAG: phosphatidate cytidylyltransferase [Thermodesulfobacteriota bacterium]|nr:phosphatidate cytidylyltransferase [Thermodesulfobacteriota bacterium]
MHLKRWLTAAVAMPILVWVVFFSPVWFFPLFIGAVAVLALFEYYQIVFSGHTDSLFSITRLSGYVSATVIVGAALTGRFDVICLAASGQLIFSGACSLVEYQAGNPVFDRVLRQVLGLIYIPLALSFLVVIHAEPHGPLWIFFLLLLVFLGDTGAFYGGRFFGKHKLLPAVSPGKTIEGAVGGMTATMGVGATINVFFPVLPWGLAMDRLPWTTALIFFMVVGVVGQAGDLFESTMKRDAGVKDSGALFPGHGGLLDRIDALIFAIPVAYLFKAYVFFL